VTVTVPNKIARLLKEDKLNAGDKYGDVYFQWVDGKECKIPGNEQNVDFKRSNEWCWEEDVEEESDEDKAAEEILGAEDSDGEDVSCAVCDEILNNSLWYVGSDGKTVCGHCLNAEVLRKTCEVTSQSCPHKN